MIRGLPSIAVLVLLFLVCCSPPAGTGEAVPLKATQRGALTLDGSLYAVAFTPDANAVSMVGAASSNDSSLGEVRLWYKTPDWERVGTLPGTKGMIDALAFSPDGRTLVTGGSESADPVDPKKWQGIVRLWDVKSGKERMPLKGHTSFVSFLKFSPDGSLLASATQTRGLRDKWRIELKLWDLTARTEVATVIGHGYSEVLEFAPNGKMVAWGIQAVTSEDRTRLGPEIKLIDVATKGELAVLRGHSEQLKSMAFAPDGKTLASGGGASLSLPVPDGRTRMLGRKALMERPGQLKLWDVMTGKERANLQGHNGCVLSIAFSPDGKMLASGGAGVPMAAPDGFWYWSGEVKLWDVATGKERMALAGHRFPKGTVEHVAFSSDGTMVASAGGTRVKLWDAASGRELAEVRGDSSETFFWVGFHGDRMLFLSRHLLIDNGIGALRGLKIWEAPLRATQKSR